MELSPPHLGNSPEVTESGSVEGHRQVTLVGERGGVSERGVHPEATESSGKDHGPRLLAQGWPLSTCICSLSQWISRLLQSTELGQQGTPPRLCSVQVCLELSCPSRARLPLLKTLAGCPLGLPLSNRAPIVGKAGSGASVPYVSLKPGLVWQSHH